MSRRVALRANSPLWTKATDDRSDELTESGNPSFISPEYLSLGLLLLTFASNQWSRQAIFYLCDFSSRDPFRHINTALDFTREAYASLASITFTLTFASFSLFAGAVADKYPRNLVAAFSCAVWSILTAVQSLAHNYWDLVPLRALIGASQAFFNPAAYTLLADIFPASQIASVNGILSGGIYLGGALASLSIILDGSVGWRNTLATIGSIGLAISLLTATVIKDPKWNGYASSVKPSGTSVVDVSLDSGSARAVTGENRLNISLAGLATTVDELKVALSEVLSKPEAKLLLAAAALRFSAGFTIGIWKAPFIFSKFPGSENSFAGGNALIVAVGGLASSIIGGYISDLLSNPPVVDNNKYSDESSPINRIDQVKRRLPIARAWVPAIGSLLAVPVWILFIQAATPSVSAGFLLVEYLVAECWFGPTLAAYFKAVPVNRRGVAQGLFSILTAAGNFAPILVGTLTSEKGIGWLGISGLPLGDVLIWVVAGSYLFSGLLFAAAATIEDESISSLSSS